MSFEKLHQSDKNIRIMEKSLGFIFLFDIVLNLTIGLTVSLSKKLSSKETVVRNLLYTISCLSLIVILVIHQYKRPLLVAKIFLWFKGIHIFFVIFFILCFDLIVYPPIALIILLLELLYVGKAVHFKSMNFPGALWFCNNNDRVGSSNEQSDYFRSRSPTPFSSVALESIRKNDSHDVDSIFEYYDAEDVIFSTSMLNSSSPIIA